MTMLAYHSDPAVKERYTARALKHQQADEVVQGSYWDGQRGCCIGCLAETEDDPHEDLAHDAGIPVMVSRLADCLHDGLPLEVSKSWPVRFSEAIPVGADLSLVAWKFLHWLLTELIPEPKRKTIPVRAAIRQCEDVIFTLKGSEVDKDVYPYVTCAAGYAASDSAPYERMADKLIEMLAEAKPADGTPIGQLRNSRANPELCEACRASEIVRKHYASMISNLTYENQQLKHELLARSDELAMFKGAAYFHPDKSVSLP